MISPCCNAECTYAEMTLVCMKCWQPVDLFTATIRAELQKPHNPERRDDAEEGEE